MAKYLFLFITLTLTQTVYSQSFTAFLGNLDNLPIAQREGTMNSLLLRGDVFPLTETDTTVCFLYRGEAKRVFLSGDETSWTPAIPFTNITGTDYWYLKRTYEEQARLDYKIVVNDTLWMLDPLNPDTCMSGYGPNSELRMPGYIRPPEAEYYPGIPHGTLRDTLISSSVPGNSRKIMLYLPNGYEKSGLDYPVVLFHDGLEFLSLANANNILDYLISREMITPLIAVFVPPVEREKEYTGTGKDAYRQFIAEELMPAIDQNYRTRKDPHERAMVGISNGGNIALFIGINNPDIFGRVAAMSSNFEPDLFTAYQRGEKADLGLYLDMGVYDIPFIEKLAVNFVEVLGKKGYTFCFHQFPEGHSWGNWKGHLQLPLIRFFPFREQTIIQ